MKKAVSLILALVLCLGLCACGSGNDTSETTEATDAPTEPSSTESTPATTPITETSTPTETEPQYTTVEITMENWEHYFEYNVNVSPRMNAFGEVETLCPVMCFRLKDEWASITTDMDVALEYNAIDTYSCMFSYNVETGEFAVGEKIEDMNSGGLWGFTRKMDETNIEAGVSLFGTPIPGRAEVEGNIAKILGSMYATIEILRIQGTITVVE